MDPKEIQIKLTKYLDTQEPGLKHIVQNIEEINMGWETELFTFQSTTNKDNETLVKDLVLRIFSGDRAGEKASKEYNLMKRLDTVGYPVPPVYYLEQRGDVLGKPFIIMKRINGKTLDATYDGDNEESFTQGLNLLIGLLVELHSLDISEFNDIPEISNTDSVTNYLSYFEESRKITPWVVPLLDWVIENQPTDMTEYRTLSHLDYHGMNIMIDENAQPYVIDWGSVRLGDSRFDLAWTILLYTTFGGPMYRAPMIEAYTRLGGKLSYLEYFEVLAVARRVTDFLNVFAGDGSAGLKPDALEMMRKSKDHFIKVHDFLEERTGFRLPEFDELLSGL